MQGQNFDYEYEQDPLEKVQEEIAKNNKEI